MHKYYILLIVFSSALAILIFQPTVSIVSAHSMQPTFLPGDIVLCRKKYSFDYSDLVIAKIKRNEIDEIILKRIVGLPNDHIAYYKKELYLNDLIVQKEYIGKLPLHSITDIEYEQIVFQKHFRIYESYFDMMSNVDIQLTDNEYFLIGDNRDFSTDSRHIGAIKGEDIVCSPFLLVGNHESSGISFNRFRFL